MTSSWFFLSTLSNKEFIPKSSVFFWTRLVFLRALPYVHRPIHHPSRKARYSVDGCRTQELCDVTSFYLPTSLCLHRQSQRSPGSLPEDLLRHHVWQVFTLYCFFWYCSSVLGRWWQSWALSGIAATNTSIIIVGTALTLWSLKTLIGVVPHH